MAIGLVSLPNKSGGILQWFGDKVKAELDRKVTARMTMAGHDMVAMARSLAAVRTGQMRDSIGFTYDQRTRTLQLHADSPHSLFVEFGTRFMTAQPFLRPAINAADRAFGVTHVMQFPTTPHLKGTTRRPNPIHERRSRSLSGTLDQGRSGKATVIIRRGAWNGPKGARPWRGHWNGRPRKIGSE